MDSRTTYAGQVVRLELTVIEFGSRVARQQAGASQDRDRAVDVAIDALVTSPLAEHEDVRRIRLLEDVDFHVRQIARLLERPSSAQQRVLRALELALSALHVPDPSAFALLDSVVERTLDDAERPLLGNVGDATPQADMRTAVLHVLAIADSARSLAPTQLEPATPVATGPTE